MKETIEKSLSEADHRKLLTLARDMRKNAWAPYSNFKVGAAVLTAKNHLFFTGCNVENASYGLTMCAERVAIFKAISEGETNFLALAISVEIEKTSSDAERMPCGACRQVMSEFMKPNSIVLVDGVGSFLLQDLLPQAFRLK